MKKILAWIKNKVLYVFDKPILLGLITLMAVALIYQASFLYGRYVSRNVFYLDKLNNQSSILAPNPKFNNETRINPGIYSRIKQQFDYANDKKQFHLFIANYFNIHYYAMTFTFTICCIFTGLLIFLITKNGWEKTEKHIFTLFLVFSATSIYFGNCPAIFKIDDNIAQNEAFFNSYCDIANKIQTFIVTTDTTREPRHFFLKDSKPDLLKESKPDSLRTHRSPNYYAAMLLKDNDRDFNNLNRISIGMDISKVKSTSDVVKTLNEATSNNTNKNTDN
jgi:hypothetical protein